MGDGGGGEGGGWAKGGGGATVVEVVAQVVSEEQARQVVQVGTVSLSKHKYHCSCNPSRGSYLRWELMHRKVPNLERHTCSLLPTTLSPGTTVCRAPPQCSLCCLNRFFGGRWCPRSRLPRSLFH